MPLLRSPNVQQLASEGNVKGLIKALGYDQEASVRMEAAGLLGQIGTREAIGPLATALKDDDEQVRLSAVTALGKIGIMAIHPLMHALKDEDQKIRERAAEALEFIGVPVAGLLLSMLKKDDPYAGVKAVVAMGVQAKQGSEEKRIEYSH